ncbi:tRNA N(3)-cytidine methyltransferase METTL2A [Anomaloglossus baeobatrachus]|uniref:tRNA N(3)-cytidine methyltransferase METTL2A n=1 Tax=Anomaloglossus baeobatrachus TaxID=238106 RepID=UPI003F5090BE
MVTVALSVRHTVQAQISCHRLLTTFMLPWISRVRSRHIHFRWARVSTLDWLALYWSRLLPAADWSFTRAFLVSAATASTTSGMEGKRPQFGNRHLKDPSQVFQHNAWDNVQWTEEQESAAHKKVLENSGQPLPPEQQEEYENKASNYWDDFYTIHENRFFKDRQWLFTEFPELSSSCKNQVVIDGEQEEDRADEHKDCPGSSSTYRILEVGCGVGNTVFPILQTNNDPGLFVYCCDFSTAAVEIVKGNPNYEPSRCFAFVHDLSDENASYPIPDESLDAIVLIFVLSAILPSKMQDAITRLSKLLKPGGCFLLRDYGRYDMAQLRFKKGRCLSENFYVRGDGTRVYFFTQDELGNFFTTAGLEKVQNTVDRRLQVNRGKQLTMYRVWIQCKYRKPNTKVTPPHETLP